MWTRIEKPFVVPTDVRQVVAQLQDAGYDAYLVGGAVRDLVRGAPVKDYDVATSAKPEEVEAVFPRVVEVGRSFGVMRVITDQERVVEVATFRKDGEYRDHRHPSSVTFSGVQEDGSRRDFTINALYYDIKSAQVLDQFGGLDDIKNKTLRAIGNPSKRFKEDALRLIRAVRFASRFQYQIEEQTRAALIAAAPTIRSVSVERIRDELERILTGPFPRAAFLELDAVGLLENVLPEVATARLESKKSWEQTLRVLQVVAQQWALPSAPPASPQQTAPSVSLAPTQPAVPASSADYGVPIALYWAALLATSLRHFPLDRREPEVRKIGARLRLSQDEIDQVAYFVRETLKFREAFTMREATLLRWMREPMFPLLMQYHEVDALAFDGNMAGLEFVRSVYPEAKRRFEMKPLIGGDDLVKLGMSPGRQFTEILRTVEDLSLEGELSSKDQALEYVLKHYVK